MQIRPFTPHRLPLKNLDWEQLVPFIGKAREYLARYDETLQKATPKQLDHLKWAESIASLRGQNSKDPLSLQQKITHARDALEFAIQWEKGLNLDFFCKVHAIVKQDALNPKEIGRLRDRQNWIGPQGSPIEDAYFYPPDPKKIRTHLQSLLNYRTEKEPLVQLAIFFAQFLIIHPFMDGNGRVIRIFVPLWLFRKGLISKPMFFLSAYFESSRLHYFRKLFNISEKGAWEDWIIYFLKGIIEQSIALKKDVGRKSPR